MRYKIEASNMMYTWGVCDSLRSRYKIRGFLNFHIQRVPKNVSAKYLAASFDRLHNRVKHLMRVCI